MYGVYATEPGTAGHYTCWALFSGLQGVTLSPMFFLNPAILSRAGLYTVGALGGLTYVGGRLLLVLISGTQLIFFSYELVQLPLRMKLFCTLVDLC